MITFDYGATWNMIPQPKSYPRAFKEYMRNGNCVKKCYVLTYELNLACPAGEECFLHLRLSIEVIVNYCFIVKNIHIYSLFHVLFRFCVLYVSMIIYYYFFVLLGLSDSIFADRCRWTLALSGFEFFLKKKCLFVCFFLL